MTTTTTLAIFAASWGVVMAIAPLLQVWRMAQRRSSSDVSLGYLAILLPGFALWIAYGAALGNAALFVPNTVAFTVDAATLVYAASLRRHHHADETAAGTATR